ncbi:MAG: DUF6348 family protein [Alphaproteobacteria bacterium]|nr:DUF6348 family protein [Alphaproteobacteria bacterium]
MTSKSFSEPNYRPQIHSANPGRGSHLTLAFSNGDREWSEDVDLVEVLRETLAEAGWNTDRRDDWLVTDRGLWLHPQWTSFQPRDDGHVSSSTTIEVAHRVLLPDPCFEYQHSIGESFAGSVRSGFQQWARMDWLVFDDLAAGSLRHCSAMEFNFPAGNGTAAGPERRLLLGPVAHLVLKDAPREPGEDEHPFCPCCLFTNAFEAFDTQLRSDRTFGLRLFAGRNAEGKLQADCRVNGEDWLPGMEALRAYAATWPDRGLETRKQYVLIGPKP